MTKISRVLALLLAGVFVLTGCARGTAESSQSESVSVSAETIIIDVRTPQEFAAGHLEGAINLDFNGGVLEQQLSTLNPDADYLVYCKSGNRASQAEALMRAAGVSLVRNIGSLETAREATGLEVISDH